MKQKTSVISIALNMMGTVIGAGIFGLPAVFTKTGIVSGSLIFFAVLALSVLLHMLFIDVILASKGKHRIPGYVGALFGPGAYWATFLLVFFKIAATVLAYIILGGEFLAMLAGGMGWFDSVWVWQLIFWVAGTAIVFFGKSLVAAVEDELTWLLVGFMLLSAAVLVPFFDWRALHALDWLTFPEVFGVMFFAVTALPIIPDMVDLAKRDKRTVRNGVAYGLTIAGTLSWIFGITIAMTYPGLSGIGGMKDAYPTIFWWLIPGIGVLAVITSFITMSQALKNMINFDLKLDAVPSWVIAMTVPLILYIFVSRDFLSTIGFVGAVLTATLGFIVCLSALKIYRKQKSRMGWGWRYAPVPIALVLVGIVFQHLISLR